jgi:Leucine-rich repeat (LRR) protein
VRLEALDLSHCRLRALPEGIGRLAGLKRLELGFCGLRALPEGTGRLAGLKKFNLINNEELTALPAWPPA